METAVLWKPFLLDSKVLPRKFCGHPSSGRGGRDVSQRMEPELPVSTWASYHSQDVRSQRRRNGSFWEVMCRLSLREWVKFRPAKTAARVEETAEAKA